MKLLLLDIFLHKKNYHALLNYKNIQIDIIKNENDFCNIDLSKYDIIYSPNIPILVTDFPQKKFIFGPHFDVFPDETKMKIIETGNISLSPIISFPT